MPAEFRAASRGPPLAGSGVLAFRPRRCRRRPVRRRWMRRWRRLAGGFRTGRGGRRPGCRGGRGFCACCNASARSGWLGRLPGGYGGWGPRRLPGSGRRRRILLLCGRGCRNRTGRPTAQEEPADCPRCQQGRHHPSPVETAAWRGRISSAACGACGSRSGACLRAQLGYRLVPDALDPYQIVNRLERAIGLALGNDRLRLSRPDARQGLELGFARRVDVHCGQHNCRCQQRGQG